MSRGGGKSALHSSSYTISNAVDYPLLGLSLYGKSTQDGVPTPENPVEIISVGDNGFDIITKNDNHFNLLSVRDNGGKIITKQPVSAAGKVNNKIGITVAATGTGLKYQWQLSADKGQTWKNSISTGNNSPTISLTISPTWNDVHLRCVITDANGKAEISNNAVIYVVSDDCEVKTASIASSALPLCGIPVDNGGNYTDSNGQQWICDELIYNADGTGKIIKRCNKIRLKSSNITGFVEHTTIGNYFYTNVKSINGGEQSSLIPISNGFKGVKFSERAQLDYFNIFKCFISIDGRILLRNSVAENDKFKTLESMRNFVDSNDVYVIYPLAESQEIALTAAEMTTLRQLQTYNGMTNIYNSNSADMDVKYCTNKMLSECVLPITTGLQKQIDGNKPALLFDGNIPTSSSEEYAEFTIDKEYSALIIAPICNESRVYELGACTVIPIGYITEEEQGFTVYGYPRATQRVNRPFIKRIGNTIYVRSSSNSCDRMIIYGI